MVEKRVSNGSAESERTTEKTEISHGKGKSNNPSIIAMNGGG
jgi:hypothetical protein